jgi:hypothetical protein
MNSSPPDPQRAPGEKTSSLPSTPSAFSALKGYPAFLLVLFAASALISGIHGHLFISAVSLLLLVLFLLLAYPFSLFLLGRGPAALIFTLPIGYILHALLLSTAGKIAGINAITFVIYVIVFGIISFLLYRRIIPAAPAHPWSKTEIRVLYLWLAAALAVIALPLIRVGTPLNEGYAYRAYFNTDFFRHMAVAANLSNHGIPPDNPYFSGYVLRYYWFFHIIPAYWTRIFPSYSLDYMMVQFNLTVALMFAATMFAAVRHFTSRIRTWIFALLLFLFGGSYEGPYILYYMHSKKYSSWMSFRDLNVDAILRWLWNAPQVDTLYRSLLYAPQHLIGLSLFLLLLMCWKDAAKFAQRLLLYILLFTVTGFTVIIAGALILGTGFQVAGETIRNPRKKLPELLISGLLGILFLASYFFLFQMFGTGAGDVKLEINRRVLANFAGFFVLNWGAVLIVGIAGIFRHTTLIPAKSLLFYLLLCILFIFFINIEVPGSSEITLKMGFLSYVILLIFGAAYLDVVKLRTSVIGSAIMVILIPALITWSMDFYNNQDITNSRFTTVVPKDDAAVYRWMRDNLEPNATAQNYTAGGEGFLQEFVTEIPALAERTTYLGDKVHSRLYQISDRDLESRKRIVWRIFHLSSPGQISSATQRAGIEYLWLPAHHSLKAFEAHLVEPYFSLSIKQGNARLYRVNPRTIQIAEMEQRVLLQNENGTVLLECDYASGFYPPEMQKGLETARWLSDDASLRLKAIKQLKGSLSLIAYAFEQERELELLLDGKPLTRKTVQPKGTHISVDLEITAGEHVLTWNAVAGPSSAAGPDHRSLSFKIWNLQFSTRAKR